MQQKSDGRTTLGRRAFGLFSIEVADFVFCDRPQPTTETVGRSVATERGDVAGYAAENFLHNVGRVRVLQP